MKRVKGLAGLVCAWALLLAPLALADLADLGRQIYMTGLRPDGSPVEALVQHDVPIPPGNGACVHCHRRSGLGVWEGPMRAPPVTGSILFSPIEGAGERPAYDADSLRRAMLAGISPAGRPLDPLMPKYRLTDEDLAGLIAYLRELDENAATGVSEDTVELATIVARDVDPLQRQALLSVLQRYAKVKNGGTRREVQRSAAAKRHPYGEQRDRAFRSWHLSVWELDGSPETWPAQLARYYAATPPFAVLSGLTGDGWPVVEQFCEDRRLPCILPITEVPADPTGFYTLHFTGGARLQGWVTATHLDAALGADDASVLMVSRDDAAGRTAREGFAAAWQKLGRPAVTEVTLPPGKQPLAGEWGPLFRQSRPQVLIAWLDPRSLQELAAAASSGGATPTRVYTAEAFNDWTATTAPDKFRRNVWHVYPYRLPPQPGLTQFPREDAWLTGQRLTDLDRITAVQAVFACHILGEGLAMIQTNYSHEYLIEQLEHALDGTDMTSLVPRTTFGPDQRFISRGAYITRLGDTSAAPRLIDAVWVQP